MSKFFPLSKAGQKNITNLLVVLAIYCLIIGIAIPVAQWLTGWIPVIGNIIHFCLWIIEIYCGIGIIIALLLWFKIIK